MYHGKSLINHALETISETTLEPVIVVLGADVSVIGPAVDDKKCRIVYNNEWQEGIAASIRTGITTLENNYPSCDGALIMVCDQPYITGDILRTLMKVQEKTGKPMAACRYENTIGTPAFFHRVKFNNLLELRGDKGAAKILNNSPVEVATVPFEPGNFDIDTTDDYKKFIGTTG